MKNFIFCVFFLLCFACTEKLFWKEDRHQNKKPPRIVHEESHSNTIDKEIPEKISPSANNNPEIAETKPDAILQKKDIEDKKNIAVDYRSMATIRKKFVFSHEDHLKKGEFCWQCHSVSTSGEITLNAQTGSLYENCISCHKEWKIDNHTALDSCWKCHDSEKAFSLLYIQKKRPQIEFVVIQNISKSSHHEIREDCKKCHLRNVEIKSFAKQKEFFHASHVDTTLSKEEIQKQCVFCHKDTQNPSIVDMDNKQVCKQCHKGQELTFLQKSISDSKPSFNHKDHTNIQNACLACHSITAEKKMETKHSCKDCHDHWKQKDIFLKSLNYCSRCHIPEQIEKQTRNILTTDSLIPSNKKR
ncbi:MAG: hypothetical protein HUU50_16185 [Candidatus Brocadiae bacterium]|nr:hypothetical protein [Candidatus Brocadiia bacterium]